MSHVGYHVEETEVLSAAHAGGDAKNCIAA